MSISKINLVEIPNKSPSPFTTKAPTRTTDDSNTSKMDKTIPEALQAKSKSLSLSSFQVRHFLNLLNIPSTGDSHSTAATYSYNSSSVKTGSINQKNSEPTIKSAVPAKTSTHNKPSAGTGLISSNCKTARVLMGSEGKAEKPRPPLLKMNSMKLPQEHHKKEIEKEKINMIEQREYKKMNSLKTGSSLAISGNHIPPKLPSEFKKEADKDKDSKQGNNMTNSKQINQIFGKNIRIVHNQEGFDIDSASSDRKDIREEMTLSQVVLNQGNKNSSGETKHSSSTLSNLYNDLLNQKYGAFPAHKSNVKKVNVRPKTTRESTQDQGSPTKTIGDTTMDSAHVEYEEHKPGQKHEKSLSLSILNQIPRGILVKRTDKVNITEDFQQDKIQERRHKSSTDFDLTKSFSVVKKFSPFIRPSTMREGYYNSSSMWSSPKNQTDELLVRSGGVKNKSEGTKSKSLTCLDQENQPLEVKGCDRRISAFTFNDLNMQLKSPPPFSRSSSVRPVKGKRMSSKSLAVRKENKEFIDLLNKINKPQVQSTLLGKDEETIIKEFIDLVQTEEFSATATQKKAKEEQKAGKGRLIRRSQTQHLSLHDLDPVIEKSESLNLNDLTTESVETSFRNSEIDSKSPGVRRSSLRKSHFLFDLVGKEDEIMQPALDKQVVTPILGSMVLENRFPDEKKEDKEGKIDLSEEEKNTEMTINITRPQEIDLKDLDSPRVNQNDLQRTLEKLENSELILDIPTFGPISALCTQESTSPSLLTIAVETPKTCLGTAQRGLSPQPLFPTLTDVEVKPEIHITTNETKEDPHSLLSSLVSATSNNKPNQLLSLSVPVEDPKPGFPISPEFGSQGNITTPLEKTSDSQPVKRNNTEDVPKFGGLASLVFRPPLPQTDNANAEGKHSLSINTIVNLKKKLKPVYIEKLNPENLKETIYASLEKEPPAVSFGDIHDLFENAPIKTTPVAQPQVVKKEIKSIVPDAKRAQNMTIMIMKFKKLSMKELREAIVNLDPNVMTVDACSTLLPFCPLPEEIKACQICTEAVEKLDTASQFLLNVYDIPAMAPRLRAMMFKYEFKERLDGILDNMNKIQVACDVLKANVNFRIFLHLSLEISNILNEGTARGSALGLKPASLLSFDTVRSNKPGLSLLVYMLQKIYEQKREILDFADDFFVMNEAVKINIEDPLRSLRELKGDFNQVRLQLEASMNRNPQDIGFINTFKEFYESSKSLVEEAEEKSNYTKDHYIQTAKFLGEDDESLKRKTSVDFFKVFKHLADTVKKFKTDEEERRKREARKAAMKKVEIKSEKVSLT